MGEGGTGRFLKTWLHVLRLWCHPGLWCHPALGCQTGCPPYTVTCQHLFPWNVGRPLLVPMSPLGHPRQLSRSCCREGWGPSISCCTLSHLRSGPQWRKEERRREEERKGEEKKERGEGRRRRGEKEGRMPSWCAQQRTSPCRSGVQRLRQTHRQWPPGDGRGLPGH